MSGIFPASPGPATVELVSNQPVVSSISDSGKRQSRIIGGHLWEIKMTWQQLLREKFAPIYAFSAKQRGDSFKIALPNLNESLGTQKDTSIFFNIDGNHTAGDNSIDVKNMVVSTIGAMKAGDILIFTASTKIYMLTEDVDTDAGGLGVLNIEPPIIEDLVDNGLLSIGGAQFTVAFKENPMQWKSTSPNIASFSVDLIEAIE